MSNANNLYNVISIWNTNKLGYANLENPSRK